MFSRLFLVVGLLLSISVAQAQQGLLARVAVESGVEWLISSGAPGELAVVAKALGFTTVAKLKENDVRNTAEMISRLTTSRPEVLRIIGYQERLAVRNANAAKAFETSRLAKNKAAPAQARETFGPEPTDAERLKATEKLVGQIETVEASEGFTLNPDFGPAVLEKKFLGNGVDTTCFSLNPDTRWAAETRHNFVDAVAATRGEKSPFGATRKWLGFLQTKFKESLQKVVERTKILMDPNHCGLLNQEVVAQGLLEVCAGGACVP